MQHVEQYGDENFVLFAILLLALMISALFLVYHHMTNSVRKLPWYQRQENWSDLQTTYNFVTSTVVHGNIAFPCKFPRRAMRISGISVLEQWFGVRKTNDYPSFACVSGVPSVAFGIWEVHKQSHRLEGPYGCMLWDPSRDIWCQHNNFHRTDGPCKYYSDSDADEEIFGAIWHLHSQQAPVQRSEARWHGMRFVVFQHS